MQTQDPTFRRCIEALHAAGDRQISWSEGIRLAGDLVGADASSLLVWRAANRDVVEFEGHGHDSAMLADYQAHYSRDDVLLDNAELGWQVSDERFPLTRWASHPFFGDFLHRYRVAQVVTLALKVDEHTIAGFSFHRTRHQDLRSADCRHGPLATFAEAATAAFSRRTSAFRSACDAVSTALTTPAQPCFVVDAHGKIVWSQLPARGRWGNFKIHDSHLITDRPDRTRAFLHLLDSATQGAEGSMISGAGKSLAVRLRAFPFPRNLGMVNGALAFIVLEPINWDRLPAAADLQEAFGLTPAQANVLRMLSAGFSAHECADQLGCSVTTIRTHIGHLMSKMGCSRQGQLIAMASALAP